MKTIDELEYDIPWEQIQDFQETMSQMSDEDFKKWLENRQLGSLDLLIGEYYD